MNKSLSRIWVLTLRNLKEILREPLSLIFIFALPSLMQILFYCLFHDLTAQFEMKYLTPSIVVFSQSFLTLFTGMIISSDRKTAFLTRLFVSKARPYEFIASYVLAVLPIAFTQAVISFVIGGVLDFSIISARALACVGLSLVSALFFVSLGVLIGAICGEKSIGGVASIVVTGQSVLSGMWFPLEGLQGGFVTFMRWLPFKNATDVIQNLLNGISNFNNDFLRPFLIIVIYVLVIFVVSVYVFRKRAKIN